MTDRADEKAWDARRARELYNIDRWGGNYFDINDAGNVVAKPLQDESIQVELSALIEEARERGLESPLLVRFQDILRHRVVQINEAFHRAIREFEYHGCYRGVFPVKVNQLREVVEEVLDAGSPYRFGLEVGSKPELFAALALQKGLDDLLICNGYKDHAYIRAALMGIKLGKKVIMVVEKLGELRQIISASREMEVDPLIGFRVRLHSKGAGKWAKSGGENAKFGLNSADLIAASHMLREARLDHCFKLVHFHIGSQVPDIMIVKRAVQEATRYYAKFVKMGFKPEYLDVGGGLGVDYDGSRTAFESSMNYSLQEYANDVVYYIAEVCQAESVPQPDIISESGRAVVAYHSVLVVEVLGGIEKVPPQTRLNGGDPEHRLVRDLQDIRDHFDGNHRLEAYHDARERRDEAHNMFSLGMLNLEDKARIETLYWEISKRVVAAFAGDKYIPEEIHELADSLSDQFLCNFSVFQSLLDHWALNQLFPIMPIGRLNERPQKDVTLVDITCDSDGQVNKFIDLQDIRNTLPLHELANGGAPGYFVGFFLMGAYQDIMGDLHNLFGRVNEIHVFLDPDEPCGYYLEEVIHGTNIAESLAYVQYDEKELNRYMKSQFDAAIKQDRLKPSEAMRLLDEYERGLRQYTYLSRPRNLAE